MILRRFSSPMVSTPTWWSWWRERSRTPNRRLMAYLCSWWKKGWKDSKKDASWKKSDLKLRCDLVSKFANSFHQSIVISDCSYHLRTIISNELSSLISHPLHQSIMISSPQLSSHLPPSINYHLWCSYHLQTIISNKFIIFINQLSSPSLNYHLYPVTFINQTFPKIISIQSFIISIHHLSSPSLSYHLYSVISNQSVSSLTFNKHLYSYLHQSIISSIPQLTSLLIDLHQLFTISNQSVIIFIHLPPSINYHLHPSTIISVPKLSLLHQSIISIHSVIISNPHLPCIPHYPTFTSIIHHLHLIPSFIITINQFHQDTAELFFEDVRLPATALLGEENKGFYYLMGELPRERLLIAIIAVASCEWVFEETRKYVKERKAFGKSLLHLQVRFPIPRLIHSVIYFALCNIFVGKSAVNSA